MKFRKWPVAAALLILLAVTLGALLKINWPASFFQEKFEKSTAQIFLGEDKLYLQFAITEKDQATTSQFTRHLGWSDQWTKGISLSLDQKTQDKLAVSLPVQLTLHFSDKRLSFQSHNLSLMNPVTAKFNYQHSSGSSHLEFKALTDSNYYLKVIDPAHLTVQSTNSGQLHLSRKVEPLFLSLAKIAKIEVKVDGKSINGEIILK